MRRMYLIIKSQDVCLQLSLCKTLLKLLQCHFTEHLKHKTVTKTTCKAPSANAREKLCAH